MIKWYHHLIAGILTFGIAQGVAMLFFDGAYREIIQMLSILPLLFCVSGIAHYFKEAKE